MTATGAEREARPRMPTWGGSAVVQTGLPGMLVKAVLLAVVLLSVPSCGTEVDIPGRPATPDPARVTDTVSFELTAAQVEELRDACQKGGVPGSAECLSAIETTAKTGIPGVQNSPTPTTKVTMKLSLSEDGEVVVDFDNCEKLGPALCTGGIKLPKAVAKRIAEALPTSSSSPTSSGPPTSPSPTASSSPQTSSGSQATDGSPPTPSSAAQ
jgi:hypothetical protein